ncbi:hypothetical protein chiPu_0031852, partial [Chiloscyllium punctatum]|nr:hypothetical protein [Chiloscyllium punctatum]
ETGVRPTAVKDLGREHHRGVPAGCLLDGRVERAAAAEHDHRAVALDAVEAHRHAVVHREADRGRTRRKLGIDDPRKRLRVVELASRQAQDDLLGRNLPRKWREIDIQISDRTPECVNIVKTKDSRHQQRRRQMTAPMKCSSRNILHHAATGAPALSIMSMQQMRIV